MLDSSEKAGLLVEALPYIKKFSGKTIVIKYGGSAMLNAALKAGVIKDIVLMKYVGINPVIVHGGGPEITALMEQMGKKATFVQGLRVTDTETMSIAEMVLVGKINPEIVMLLNFYGAQAVGLSGKDAKLIRAKKSYVTRVVDGETRVCDIGYVGDVEAVNPEILAVLSQQGYIPVIAPIGVGEDLASYNINADSVAGAVAGALKADKLILLTDVEGIFANPRDPATLISTLKAGDVAELIACGAIDGGMIPKVRACVAALEEGVNKTHIIDGRVPHALLLEIFTDRGIGTEVVK